MTTVIEQVRTSDTALPGSRTVGVRVLFLEDEALLAMTYGEALRRVGIGEVVMASSLAEANKVLDEAPVDVAVLDVNIDGEPSLDVARRVSRSGGRVVFTTGYTSDRHDLDQMSDAVIRKPYREADLIDAVTTAGRQAAATR